MRLTYLRDELIGQIVPVKELRVGDVIQIEGAGEGNDDIHYPKFLEEPSRITVCIPGDNETELCKCELVSNEEETLYLFDGDVVRLLERAA